MPRMFKVSESVLTDGTVGICLACGELAEGVEPDARKYLCDVCEKNEVYGLEEALVMGRIELLEEESE